MSILKAIAANLKAKHPRLAQKAEEEVEGTVSSLNALHQQVKKTASPEALDFLNRLVQSLDLADSVDFDVTVGQEGSEDEDTDLDAIEVGDDPEAQVEEAEEDLDLDLDGDDEEGEPFEHKKKVDHDFPTGDHEFRD